MPRPYADGEDYVSDAILGEGSHDRAGFTDVATVVVRGEEPAN